MIHFNISSMMNPSIALHQLNVGGGTISNHRVDTTAPV